MFLLHAFNSLEHHTGNKSCMYMLILIRMHVYFLKKLVIYVCMCTFLTGIDFFLTAKINIYEKAISKMLETKESNTRLKINRNYTFLNFPEALTIVLYKVEDETFR